ncbi:hypothetical protein [Streptomyces sp. NBC_00525]|uniref:hypothetical protein n=1 Tax=Streptomyces sp. NBC_00525 TaxID=2903660 RepID=UPI002E80B2EF|nr:hypothetical protein [Streptomyces sp. NBC_00525]WUC95059.1 hypothetical protein OG710_16360 [Streptomyces sp. NBC_00525]
MSALTRSGPSYVVGMTRKLSPAEADVILTEEIGPLVMSIRPTLAKVKTEVMQLDRNRPEASCEHLAEIQRLLGHMIESIELDYIEMTNRFRRSLHPFSLVEHYRIWHQRRQMLGISRAARGVRETAAEAVLELRRMGIGSPTVGTFFDRLNVATNLMAV